MTGTVGTELIRLPPLNISLHTWLTGLTTIELHSFMAISRNSFLLVAATVYGETLLSGSMEPGGRGSIEELFEKERREARRKGEYCCPVIQEILLGNVGYFH